MRWIEQPGITIGTLPGAGATERLAAGGDGCQWRTEDIARLYAELTAKPGLPDRRHRGSTAYGDRW